MRKEWKDNNNITHYGKHIASKNGYDAIECEKCRFIHVIPLPSEKELDKYYKDIFYSDYKPDYINNHKKDIDWWTQIFKQRFNLFDKYLISKKAKRILDIGSGPGFFLKYFKDIGWDAIGIEPSQSAAEFSRGLGLEIHQNSIFKFNLEKLGKFDIIHSNQTFEHLVDPNEALQIIRSLLKPNGLIFLCVANDFNPIQKILNKKMGFPDWWFTPPEHVNYFSIESVLGLLTKNGFEPLDKITTFPIDLFLLMGDNYIESPSIGKICHTRRKNFELNLIQSNAIELKNTIYKQLFNVGIGREIEILAKINS